MCEIRHCGSGDSAPRSRAPPNIATRRFTRALIKGVSATLAFAVGANAAANAGAGLWSVLAAGYIAWLVAWATLQSFF